MKYVRIVIILVLLLFLLSCQQGLTGLVSLEDYEDILVYENQTISEDFSTGINPEYFIEADEPIPAEEPTLQTGGGDDGFHTAAVHAVTSCFRASNVGADDDTFVLQNDLNKSTRGDCVILDLHNITLDCDGYAIYGNHSSADDGIAVVSGISGTNITIKNCRIYNFTLANDTGGGIYDFSYGITIGMLGRNVTIKDTVIYDIRPTAGFGGGGIRFNTLWAPGTGWLRLDNVTVYNSANGVRIGTGTLAGPGGPVLIEGPFWTLNSNFTNNTYFQYLGYQNIGNHYINNTYFGAGRERSLQIAGNTTFFLAGTYLENITIQNSVFAGGTYNYSDIFIAKAKNVTIRDNVIHKNIIVVNSTNVTITGNNFDNPAASVNYSLNGMYLNTVSNFWITGHANVVERLFDLADVNNGTIADNSFTGNGKIRVTQSPTWTGNTNILIQNNTFNNVLLLYQTAAGIFFMGSSSTIDSNKLYNGHTYSIEIDGNSVNVTNNNVENTTGIAFKIWGDNNYVFANNATNHTGTVFWIDGTNHDFVRNRIIFNLKMMNTSLNYDPTTGPYSFVPEGGQAFLLSNTTNLNISDNEVAVLNPLNLRVGVFGIRSINMTMNETGDIFPAITRNLTVFNNTFGIAAVSNWGLKTDIYLVDSYSALIRNNTFSNTEHESIIIDSGRDNNILENKLRQIVQNVNPYYKAVGIKLFRTRNNTVEDNMIENFDTGIYCYNSSIDNYLGNQINHSSRHGIFLFRCYNSTIIGNTIFNATIGLKLLYSNFSRIDTNLINRTVIGFDFNQAHNNTISGVNIQENGTIGLNLDLFSSGNVFNANVFANNTDVDILYDMFAHHNMGAGNTYSTNRSENYAANNAII